MPDEKCARLRESIVGLRIMTIGLELCPYGTISSGPVEGGPNANDLSSWGEISDMTLMLLLSTPTHSRYFAGNAAMVAFSESPGALVGRS